MRSQRLYFSLNQAQHRLRKSADRQCLQAIGASTAQLGALFFIRDHEPCSQADIASEFGQDESAATGMLSRMQNAGLIARERDHDDRRVTRVSLTPAGRDVLNQGDVLLKAFNQRLTRGFTRDELAVVQRFLSSIIERVDAGKL
jgi:MarR family transcriptional regulator, organic hydroperoxide resistance regulator